MLLWYYLVNFLEKFCEDGLLGGLGLRFEKIVQEVLDCVI